mgnify:CR=1 FL=1
MKWLACEKSTYKICIKNTYLVLIYSEFYCIIHINKLRLCLFCIKTEMPLRKENGRRYASKDALFSAIFYLFFMEGDQNGLPC